MKTWREWLDYKSKDSEDIISDYEKLALETFENMETALKDCESNSNEEILYKTLMQACDNYLFYKWLLWEEKRKINDIS
jgi:hypothetical protein